MEVRSDEPLNARLFALQETQNKANQNVFYARKRDTILSIVTHGTVK